MAHAKKRQPVDVVDLDRRADHIEDSRQQADGNASRLDLAHEVEHVPGGLLRRLDYAFGSDRAPYDAAREPAGDNGENEEDDPQEEHLTRPQRAVDELLVEEIRAPSQPRACRRARGRGG